MKAQSLRTNLTVLIAAVLFSSLPMLPVWSLPARAQTPVPGPQKATGPPQPQDATRGIGLVRTLPGKAKRFALVIGVDRYDDPQVVGLGGAANDARLLAASLVRYAGFPRDQVIVLASGESPERRPTRGNILRRLANLA